MGCLCSKRYNENQYNAQIYPDDERISANQENKLKELNLNEALSLKMYPLSKKCIASTLTEQKWKILCQIKPDGNIKNESVDVVAVIDTSRSMKGEKLNNIKKGIQYLLNNLNQNDRLSLIQFNQVSKRLTPLIKMTQSGKDKILSALNKVNCEKITNTSSGLITASQVIHSRRYTSSKPCVMLFSDGANRAAISNCQYILTSYIPPMHQYQFFTFAVGYESDETVLTHLANTKQGKFYPVENDVDKYDRYIKDALSSLSTQITGAGQLTIKPDDAFGRVELVECVQDRSTGASSSKSGTNFIVNIPSISGGKSADIILTVNIPKAQGPVDKNNRTMRVASSMLSIADLGGEEYVMKSDAKIEFYNEEEEIGEIKADPEVAVDCFKTLAKVKIADSRSGNPQNGKKNLTDLLEEIQGSGLLDKQGIEEIVSDIKDRIEEIGDSVNQQPVLTGKNMKKKNRGGNRNQSDSYEQNVLLE